MGILLCKITTLAVTMISNIDGISKKIIVHQMLHPSVDPKE